MTKASLDPEFVLITTDALNSFAKHLTSTGRSELARTLVQQAADLKLISPELQIWQVRAHALVEAQAVATAEIARLEAELGRTQGGQAKLSNNLHSLSEESSADTGGSSKSYPTTYTACQRKFGRHRGVKQSYPTTYTACQRKFGRHRGSSQSYPTTCTAFQKKFAPWFLDSTALEDLMSSQNYGTLLSEYADIVRSNSIRERNIYLIDQFSKNCSSESTDGP